MAGISTIDLKDIDNVTVVARKREAEMRDLDAKVGDMGSLSLFWDSKVPEKDKGFFNFFSLKVSDPEDMREEIAKYKDFYSDLKNFMKRVRNGESTDEDTDVLILELYDTLKDMAAEAESKAETTDSSTLYKLHKDFSQKHQQLENMVKRVECVVVRQQLRRVRDDWRNALGEIAEIRQDLRQARQDNDDLRDRFERLMTINEGMAAQQAAMLQENQNIRYMLTRLLEQP